MRERAVRLAARVLWPAVLIGRLLAYGLTDRPTHILFWGCSRGPHLAIYAVGALAVLICVGPTPWRWLVAKTALITGVAVAAILGDIYVGAPGREWLSITGWAVLIVGNWMATLFRLTWMDEKGRA